MGSYATSGHAIGVAVSGNHAYVADSAGMQILDVTNPANPQRVGAYNTRGLTGGFSVSGNYAYVLEVKRGETAVFLSPGLQIIDVRSPANPQPVGQYEAWGWDAHDVAVSGNYVYVANGIAGLHVLDVSSPANPQRVGQYVAGGARATGVAVSGNYAYLAVEFTGLHVIDVSNPANPQRVGGYETSGEKHEVAVQGNYAYVVDRAGLHIIDVSDPTSPRRVGGNTAISARGVVATEDYLYVSTDRGLAILHQFKPLTGPALSFGPVRAGQNGIALSLQGLPGLKVDMVPS
jgi:hypothetical protein